MGAIETAQRIAALGPNAVKLALAKIDARVESALKRNRDGEVFRLLTLRAVLAKV